MDSSLVSFCPSFFFFSFFSVNESLLNFHRFFFVYFCFVCSSHSLCLKKPSVSKAIDFLFNYLSFFSLFYVLTNRCYLTPCPQNLALLPKLIDLLQFQCNMYSDKRISADILFEYVHPPVIIKPLYEMVPWIFTVPNSLCRYYYFLPP